MWHPLCPKGDPVHTGWLSCSMSLPQWVLRAAAAPLGTVQERSVLCPASLGLTAQDSEPQEVIAFCSPTQILENTPENHPDHSHLKHALEKAEELCSQVNEGVREKENSDRLEWIQAHVQCEGLSEVSGFGGGARARPA